MIIAFGSFIWHVVFDLIGIIVAIILLFIIGDAVYTIHQQYMKHLEKWTPSINLSQADMKDLSKMMPNRKCVIDKHGNLRINGTKDGDSRDKNNSVSH